MYDPLLVAASVLVAIIASLAALWLASSLRDDASPFALYKKMASAVIMGLAIISMHYTGMAAANFPLGSVCLVEGGVDALTLDGHVADPDLKAAIGCADMYRLTAAKAKSLVDEIYSVVKNWCDEANRHDLPHVEIQRMETVIHA